MACFHPLEAVYVPGQAIRVMGEVTLRDYQLTSGERLLELPCGKCIGCRIARARAWAIRCMHEASMYDVNSFVTLTYDDDHYQPSLCYRDFQIFMYRLRRKLGPTRFFMCGEYGDINGRPHFHALLFGRSFRDPKPIGKDIYYSRELGDLWSQGMHSFGAVTFQSASYVSRYCLKKVTGPPAEAHYTRVDIRTGEFVRVEPEFCHMSLNRGIGYNWFVKHWRDVYLVRDGVPMPGGHTVPPPRFYDKLLLEQDFSIREEKDFQRYMKSDLFREDCSPERLLTREVCAKARESFKRSRNL